MTPSLKGVILLAKLSVTDKYGVTPNEILNSSQISFKAKGLWGYMQSKPDGWQFTINGITAQTKDGVDSVRSAVNELIDVGLLTRTIEKTKDGTISNYTLVATIGKAKVGKAKVGKAKVGKAKIGKSNTSKKEESKKEESKKEESKKDIGTNVPMVKPIPKPVKPDKRNPMVERAFEVWQEVMGTPIKRDRANSSAAYNIMRAKDKGETWLIGALKAVQQSRRDKYKRFEINNLYELQRDWEKLLGWVATERARQESMVASAKNIKVEEWEKADGF